LNCKIYMSFHQPVYFGRNNNIFKEKIVKITVENNITNC
jgi:hypothetical protein